MSWHGQTLTVTSEIGYDIGLVIPRADRDAVAVEEAILRTPTGPASAGLGDRMSA
jgi:hypothetical protein